MKKQILLILIFLSSFTFIYSQDPSIYINTSTNLLLFNRVYPEKDPIPNDNNLKGNLSLGIGVGINLISPIGLKSSVTTEIDFAFKKRDHYFLAGALFYRLDEQLVMNTIKITSRYERRVIKKLNGSLGGFIEYALDKNQNFNYTQPVYSSFNYGPSIAFDLIKNNWRFKVSFDYGIAIVVDYRKDQDIQIQNEYKSYIKLSSLQFSIGYKLFSSHN